MTSEVLLIAGSREAALDGVTMHSVRLRGLVAHQEVLFGGLGQTLSIKHETISREAFMPGVLLAVKEAVQQRRYIFGLEGLLGFSTRLNLRYGSGSVGRRFSKRRSDALPSSACSRWQTTWPRRHNARPTRLSTSWDAAATGRRRPTCPAPERRPGPAD